MILQYSFTITFVNLTDALAFSKRDFMNVSVNVTLEHKSSHNSTDIFV